MKNNQAEYLDNISNKLAWLAQKISQDNRANWTSTATQAEGFYKEFLNTLYGWNLTNANVHKQNCPGVDLVSDNNKIIIQISSTKSKTKIQKSIDEIDIHTYKGYHFIFLVIGDKLRSYSHIEAPKEIHFNRSTDIWDHGHLLVKAGSIDIERLKKLSEMVDKYYETTNCTVVSANKINVQGPEKFIGHCIQFGLNCCRIFEVYKGEKSYLVEAEPCGYRCAPPTNKQQRKAYLDELIRITKEEILSIVNTKGRRFVKVIADAEFNDAKIFPKESDKDKFIVRFYNETGLYFNILTHEQTAENMKVLFNNAETDTAIIDICSTCVHVVMKIGGKTSIFKHFKIDVSTQDIKKLSRNNDDWDENKLKEIKDFVKDKVGKTFGNKTANTAIIIKDEASFMDKMGYPLTSDGANRHIGFEDYIEANREKLYPSGFNQRIDNAYSDIDPNTRRKYYGFKEGHIILESIFEILQVETVIPTDVSNILKSPMAYVFNVVLTGSTRPNQIYYMKEAHRIFKEMGIQIMSPTMISLGKKTPKTYQQHQNSIKECDLLFVCNGNHYIGQQTRCDIYGASLLSKPIAYWKEPITDATAETIEILNLIPHERWAEFMNEYCQESLNNTIKGCVIGSFRKYYEDISSVVETFEKNNIRILSPKVSKIINPDAEFVLLESDDGDMEDAEIQAQVFEHTKMSDFVYVWDPDGYIGRTTCYEIGRIIERKTPIYYKEYPKDIPLSIPENAIISVEDLILYYRKNNELPLGSQIQDE